MFYKSFFFFSIKVNYLLTLGAKTATINGEIIPVIPPIPFMTAISVPAKFGLKSNALIFIPG